MRCSFFVVILSLGRLAVADLPAVLAETKAPESQDANLRGRVDAVRAPTELARWSM